MLAWVLACSDGSESPGAVRERRGRLVMAATRHGSREQRLVRPGRVWGRCDAVGGWPGVVRSIGVSRHEAS